MQYTVLDIETTGLSRHAHKITEIAAVKCKNGLITNRYQSLINPEVEIPSFITTLTGIDNRMVKDAPTIQEELPKFLRFLGNNTIIAHNASFDYNFISHNSHLLTSKHLANDKVCTRKLANRLLPDLPRKRLSDLCQLFRIDNNQAHRAMSDVEATQQVFDRMRKLLELKNIKEMSEIIKFQKTKLS